MSETEEPKAEPKERPDVNFSWTTTALPTYEDGFAEGYSRAWKECWNQWLAVSDEEKKSE